MLSSGNVIYTVWNIKNYSHRTTSIPDRCWHLVWNEWKICRFVRNESINLLLLRILSKVVSVCVHIGATHFDCASATMWISKFLKSNEDNTKNFAQFSSVDFRQKALMASIYWILHFCCHSSHFMSSKYRLVEIGMKTLFRIPAAKKKTIC